MSEHIIAARAALADEIREATELLTSTQTRIDCANAALAALLYGFDANTGPVPLVRPPAPSVPDPPVEIPKRDKRPRKVEQRPAAKNRVESMQAAAKKFVDCPSCGRSFSQLGLGAHRRSCRGPVTATTAPTEVEPQSELIPEPIVGVLDPEATQTLRPAVMPVVNAPTGGRVLMCDECEFEIDYAIGAVNDMSRHTLGKHERRPSIAERAPMPKGSAA